LIDDDHLDRIAEEINENLQQSGQITVVELSKQYELPMEFVLQVSNACASSKTPLSDL
jgi:hypothetical protein